MICLTGIWKVAKEFIKIVNVKLKDLYKKGEYFDFIALWMRVIGKLNDDIKKYTVNDANKLIIFNSGSLNLNLGTEYNKSWKELVAEVDNNYKESIKDENLSDLAFFYGYMLTKPDGGGISTNEDDREEIMNLAKAKANDVLDLEKKLMM